jgi:DNA replication protein DnaC
MNFEDLSDIELRHFTRLTGILDKMSFKNFEIQKGNERAFTAAWKWASLDERLNNIWSDESEDRFTKDVDYQNYIKTNELCSHLLTLCGDNGTGKTHLAVSSLRARGKNMGLPYEYWETSDLLHTLRTAAEFEKQGKELHRFPSFSGYSPDPSYSGIIQRLCGDKYPEHLLLLDDIGTAKYSPWALEILQLIVDKRYISNSLPTIFTTNNIEKLPPRIASRIKSGVVVPIIDKDYRETKGKLATLKATRPIRTGKEVPK